MAAGSHGWRGDCLLSLLGDFTDFLLLSICYLCGGVILTCAILWHCFLICIRGDAEYMDEELAEEEWRVWNAAWDEWDE